MFLKISTETMIERIVIENFKSIRHLDLELKPINILIGANGAGKSNFISFFSLTNHIYKQRLQEYIGNNIDNLLYFGRKNSDFMEGLFFSNKYAISYILRPNKSGNFGYLEEFNIFNPNDESKTYYYDSLIQETDFFLENSQKLDKIKKHLSELRIYHFDDTSEGSMLRLAFSEINDNYYLKENGQNFASILYWILINHPQNFKNIELQVRSVASFFDRFVVNPTRNDSNYVTLGWLEKGSDVYFNAHDLSDGTLRFMALTTLLLQPDLPKTIIIDEPELGLHPFALNKLAAMMKQAAVKGSQVIVSTQSVNLVDNFEPEDIITVDREDNQSVFRRLDSEELKDWLEDYTLGELWNKNVIGARP